MIWLNITNADGSLECSESSLDYSFKKEDTILIVISLQKKEREDRQLIFLSLQAGHIFLTACHWR